MPNRFNYNEIESDLEKFHVLFVEIQKNGGFLEVLSKAIFPSIVEKLFPDESSLEEIDSLKTSYIKNLMCIDFMQIHNIKPKEMENQEILYAETPIIFSEEYNTIGPNENKKFFQDQVIN